VAITVQQTEPRPTKHEPEAAPCGVGPRGRFTPPATLVVVEDLDRKTIHALQYARTIRSRSTSAVHVERDPENAERLRRRWDELVDDVPLEVIAGAGDPGAAVARHAEVLAVGADVALLVPGPARMGRLERLRRGRTGARLTRLLAPNPRVHVMLVRDHPHGDDVASAVVLSARTFHRAVVLVDRPDRAALGALRYALSLGADEVVAVHAAVDPEMQDDLIERWMDLRIPVELELVECWDRDVARSVERYVVDLVDRTTDVTVVLPRRDFPRLTKRLLHDRTSRGITRALGRYEHVDIAVVPCHLGDDGHAERGDLGAERPRRTPGELRPGALR
jgi:hypothetical protein